MIFPNDSQYDSLWLQERGMDEQSNPNPNCHLANPWSRTYVNQKVLGQFHCLAIL